MANCQAIARVYGCAIVRQQETGAAMNRFWPAFALSIMLPLGACTMFAAEDETEVTSGQEAEGPWSDDGMGTPVEPAPPPPPPIIVAEGPSPDNEWTEQSGGGGASGTPAAPQSEGLPDFPWPPPRWSARKDMTDLARHHAQTLGALSDNLVTALNAAGYPEYSLYEAPGGFALAARLERTDEDGTPNGDFRFLSPDEEEPFDLTDYISALFFTPEGYYRQIVFVVTDEPFVAADDAPTAAAAERILADGASALTLALREQPVTEATRVFALIYEFRKGAGPEDVAILTPGRLDGDTHMTRSGIAAALAALAGN